MSLETVLTNARVVTADAEFDGTVCLLYTSDAADD